MSTRSPSQPAAQPVVPLATQQVVQQEPQQSRAQELARAEERGAQQLRERLRHLVADRRRIVRLGEQQIEVVEVSALREITDHPE